MSALDNDRLALALQLRDIEQQDERRKHLISLCVMKAVWLSQKSMKTSMNDQEKHTKSSSSGDSRPISASETPASLATSNSDALQKKLQSFELQVASLKMQLSTKEQAHAAKVDELQEELTRLHQERANPAPTPKIGLNGTKKVKLTRNGAKLTAVGSPISRNRPVSSFFANSPFSDSKSGKGNSFSGVGITSLAAKASFKLSHKAPKPADDVFSPNNSSAESTPKKSKPNHSMLEESSRIELQQKKNTDKPTETDINVPHIETSSTNLTVSDPEETFQSANATFDTEKGKKTKKRRIRLVSSEASKLLLASQDRGLEEGEDLNSVKYYQDENFGSDAKSPVPALKRPKTAEPVAKKKHVFKIG
ncbi:hypothetical protein OXX79_003198 [Metschnikowia pulcherrima]